MTCTGCARNDPHARLQESPTTACEDDGRWRSITIRCSAAFSVPGVNRRDLLQVGWPAALGSLIPTSATFAQEKKLDPTMQIGYLPITDASRAAGRARNGLLQEGGARLRAADADPRLVAPGRGLLVAPLQPDAPADPDSDLDALQQQVPDQDHGLEPYQRLGHGRRQGRRHQLAQGLRRQAVRRALLVLDPQHHLAEDHARRRHHPGDHVRRTPSWRPTSATSSC